MRTGATASTVTGTVDAIPHRCLQLPPSRGLSLWKR